MDTGYSLAFVAGVVAALNPCGFAMLPGYLGLAAGDGRRASGLARALGAAAAMTVGFTAVFAGFALLAIPAAEMLARVLPYFTVLIGALLVVIGARQLAGRTVGAARLRLPQWGAPTGSVRSMLGYGVLYALVSLTCIVAPFLAVTGIGLRGPGHVWGALVAYAAGFAALVGAVAVAGVLAGAMVLRWLRGGARFMPWAGGLLLIATGLYIGYYGGYELRLRTAAGPDPVIAVAQRIQSWLARGAYAVGSSGWGVTIAAVLGVTALVLIWRAERIRLQNKVIHRKTGE
jgi:cytochrome c biogenesis protein CcdA